MSENENIEAKLCSYVEGDLDAEGRAEIEKYLLAHPRYRPLIDELKRTRGLLRQLPRESASSELLETLSGQIERSALLGDDDGPAGRIHSNRMPQLAAWAAVLLLTAGLAAVVYRVLPANKTQPEVALLKEAPRPVIATQAVSGDLQKQSELDVPALPSPATEQVAQGVPPEAAAPPTTNADQLAIARSEAPMAAPMAPATAPAVASATVVMDGTSTAGNALATDRSRDFVVGGDATQLGQNMYVTVRAADAKVANGRITAYLANNQIPFESRLETANLSDSAALQRKMPTSIFFSTGTPVNSQAGGQFTFKSAAGLHAAPAGFDPTAVHASAATQFATDAIGATTQSGTNAPLSTNNVIIARNLSPEQVKKLTSDLAIDVASVAHDGEQPALRQDAQQADDQSADGLLKSGQKLRIIARDNSLPGVEAMNEQQAIDSDGNITLPLVGKVRAAGLTEAELSQNIPIAYRDAKSPTTATWSIERAVDNIASMVPSTEPTLSLTQTTAPSVLSSIATAAVPTSQPAVAAADKDLPLAAGAATPANQMGDQKGIDVTIRVVTPSVSSTMPTTSPMVGSSDESAPAAAAPVVALPPSQTSATAPTTMP
jgi:hypothetical protein